jgi:sterol 3beta-glucosyltransferase
VAGRPQVIWPFGIDQPFWSGRMSRLGVAPAALPVRALTGRTLTAALDRALGDPRITERAAGLGARVRGEDGVGQAVSRLEEVLAGTRLAVGA